MVASWCGVVLAWGVGLAAPAAGKAPAPAKPAAPSVAVFNLEPQAGLSDGVSKLMTEHVAALLRESSAFGRVVASADLMALVDLERQKQMANCANDSCMAELAGALGVEFLVTGNLGKLGESYLLNIKMLDVKRAVTLASVSERFMGKSEEALLDGVQPAVFKLLNLSGLRHTLAQQGKISSSPAPVQVEQPPAAPATPSAPPASASPAPAAQPAPVATGTERPGWVIPVLGVGVVAAVGGAAVVFAAVVAAAVTVTWAALNAQLVLLPEVFGREQTRTQNLLVTYAAGAVVAAGLGLVGLLILGSGATAAVVAAFKL